MITRSTTTGPFARTVRRGLLAVAATVGVALQSSAVRAQEPPAEENPPVETTTGEFEFAVQPSGPDGPGLRDWFVYTLDPGAVFGDTVAISNLSDHPIRFTIFPTDAVSVPETAGFAALRDDEAPSGVGTWIQLAANEYTVEPNSRIDVPFSITVPEDAEPGDHAGAILAFDADAASIDPSAAPEGISFDVRQRLGARVYVRVNGPLSPAVSIDELAVERDGKDATITWEVTNTGNVRLSPTAEVRITGFLGRTVQTVPAQQLPELLPGGNFVGGTAVTDLPRFERLTAHLVVRAEGVDAERSTSFGSYPLAPIGIAVLLVVASVLLWRWRRNHGRPSSPGPPSPADDRMPAPV